MTHSELCEETAKHFVKKAWLALWEYQSFATGEFPDCLIFGSGETVLFEIKMSRADFLVDSKKEARKKWKPRGYVRYETDWRTQRPLLNWIQNSPELYYIEAPHLGMYRYFVCEPNIITFDDLPEGWGLYWYNDGKFRQKRESKKFRANVRDERQLVAHALRKYASGRSDGIIVNTYAESKA